MTTEEDQQPTLLQTAAKAVREHFTPVATDALNAFFAGKVLLIHLYTQELNMQADKQLNQSTRLLMEIIRFERFLPQLQEQQ
ncbi:MAG TPA: hypothetical protein VN711_01540 [Candidatus Saccharimonadales bacterium]|nr:hypothetical protein [Candidatus Saccharimonadales bacterium]